MNNSGNSKSIFAATEFVAFDTETTGIWAPGHKIVEIAGVKFSIEKGLIGTFQELINPGRAMSPEVIAVHGITDDMLVGRDKADQVLRRFEQFCAPDAVMIAHNAGFDISFVACELERLGRKFSPNRVLDTIDIFRKFFPGEEFYSLLSLAKSFSIAESQEHRALQDAELVRRLFMVALDKMPSFGSWEEIESLLQVARMDSWQSATTDVPAEFEPILGAIQAETKIEMTYSSPTVSDSTRTIKPIQIFRHGRHLYLMAYCFLVNDERTFRLDRIGEFKLLNE
ncbi:MAG: exonuclease domain-containing protein [bacterium]|nr:exonuclease domain-containing protein [bacterium]